MKRRCALSSVLFLFIMAQMTSSTHASELCQIAFKSVIQSDNNHIIQRFESSGTLDEIFQKVHVIPEFKWEIGQSDILGGTYILGTLPDSSTVRLYSQPEVGYVLEIFLVPQPNADAKFYRERFSDIKIKLKQASRTKP